MTQTQTTAALAAAIATREDAYNAHRDARVAWYAASAAHRAATAAVTAAVTAEVAARDVYKAAIDIAQVTYRAAKDVAGG